MLHAGTVRGTCTVGSILYLEVAWLTADEENQASKHGYEWVRAVDVCSQEDFLTFCRAYEATGREYLQWAGYMGDKGVFYADKVELEGRPRRNDAPGQCADLGVVRWSSR